MTGSYHPPISRRAITHLFWGQYPYKVETIYPAQNFRRYVTLRADDYVTTQAQRYRRSVGVFRRACMKSVPKNKSIWRLQETSRSLHFFFEHKEDMERFVAGNQRRIRAIFEPASENEVAMLQQSKHSYLRRTLFYNAFRYCVIFRALAFQVAEELDRWIEEFFGDSQERFQYSAYGARRLYLRDENDVLLVHLAFSKYILRVQKVILRSEVSDDYAIGEAIDGEGGDSA